MVTLRPMSASSYQNYRATMLQEYANEQIKARNWTKEEAIEKANKQLKQLLPDGVQTKGHFLFSLLHDNHTIGVLWIKLIETSFEQSAYIYDIHLDEAYQGQGLGTATMTALESFAHTKGLKQIKLHVFAHNTRAIALYKKMNYQMTDHNMIKEL